MDKMRALVKTAPETAALLTIPIPRCGSRDVLIRVKAAALCGTDLHIYDWNLWAQSVGISLPLVMGHECCGDVVAVGDAVTTLRIGDKVACETHVPCGECYQCLNGQQHICSNLKLFGIHINGCFAEYALLPAMCARKIPRGISYDIGAVMEPLGTAWRAAQETRVGGANVVVLGCGPIGLFAVASALALGAAKVAAVDILPARLEMAKKIGAHMALNALSDQVGPAIQSATKGYGADVVIEASGSVDALKQSFQYLRKGGRVALIGLPGKPLSLDLAKEVVFKEAVIIGIHGRKMFETWTQMENLLVSGKLAVESMLTHVLPLSLWQEGIALAKNGQACKVIYHP